MILIFDLDDTLYEELTYVESGFRAVARYGSEIFGLEYAVSYQVLTEILRKHGRGKIFDRWLDLYRLTTRERVKKCVQIYRQHLPDIHLYPEAREVLSKFSRTNSLFLVTDGNKLVQSRKVEALGISSYFRKIYITHRYGLKASKPSLICFERIKNLMGVQWKDMIYVGDNPKKDFVSLKAQGMKTIRVHTGQYREVLADDMHSADISISNISCLKHHLVVSGQNGIEKKLR